METSKEIFEQEAIELKPEPSLPNSDNSDSAAEKHLLWKLDIHVIPILMVLFLLAFLDRINIGNARLQGLEDDLNMTGNDFNIALFIFFIPYVLLEVPSNLLLKRIAPSWWISGIMFCWGLCEYYFPGRPLLNILDPRNRHDMPGSHCKLRGFSGLSVLVGRL